MDSGITFREAKAGDSTDLALILDIAGRGLPTWAWSQFTERGQSSFERGREQIKTDITAYIHYKDWYVVELKGAVVGAFCGFSVESPYPEIDFTEVLEPLHPILGLEKIASGCWLVQAIALFPEGRGKGCAQTILSQAEKATQSSGAQKIALQVEELNEVALCIYKKFGSFKIARRQAIPFPGSDDTGDYILMQKSLR